MARKPLPELSEFLQPFSKEVQKIALQLREFVLNIFPDSNELIYDNYNALAIGYSLSEKQKDMFCHIAVYSKYVNIGFDKGIFLNDPEKMLKGTGSRIRHIKVPDYNSFNAVYVKKILAQAHQIAVDSLESGEQLIKAVSLVKSTSVVKKRPA